MKVIDLSHPFQPGQPHYPGDPDQVTETVAEIDRDGFLMHRYQLVGPWGTHVDAPSHFDPTGRTLGDIDVSETVLPLFRISFTGSGLFSAADLSDFESRHGPVTAGSFVALHTGWSWGASGTAPGWSVEALQRLHARGVTAIGHDLPDTDPTLEAQRWWLRHDHWQIENMTNLHLLPATGARIVCAWPVPRGGASFPVRPIALL